MFGEELVLLFLHAVPEFLLHLVIWFPWDLFVFWREVKSSPERRSSDPWLVPIGGLLLGGIFGGLSLLVVRTTLLGTPDARVANLVLGPFLCAGLAWLLARRRTHRGRESSALLHFWFALAFSAAFLVVRFVWAQRPA